MTWPSRSGSRGRIGATAAEYGLLVSLVIVLLIGTLKAISTRLLLVMMKLIIIFSHGAGSPQSAMTWMDLMTVLRGVTFDEEAGVDNKLDVDEYEATILSECEFISIGPGAPDCAENLAQIDIPAQHTQMDADEDGFVSRQEYLYPAP